MNSIFSALLRAHAFAENREIQRFDAREQRAVSMHEKPERAAAICVDQIEKLGAFFVQLPGAIGFEAQQFADAERGFASCEVCGRDAVARQVFFGKIDAAERVVFVDVANNVGELKGEAEFFGEIERARIAESQKRACR